MNRPLAAVPILFAVLLLAGCAGSFPGVTVKPPQLSPAEEVRLGQGALPYVLQLLGGAYPDSELQATLDQVLARQARTGASPDLPFRVRVADQTESRLVVLSGGQIVVTRGLLASLQSRGELAQVLAQAVAAAAQRPFGGGITRDLAEAADAVLAGVRKPYSPASPQVRLARAFIERPGPLPVAEVGSNESLPESWTRLEETRPAYELLAEAQRIEAAGERNAAIAACLQAAALAPDEPRILAELGMAYLRAGDLQSARIHLEKAVELQPDYYRTRMGLGYLALQNGPAEAALRHLTKSVDLLPVTENLYLLAETLERVGDRARAREIYANIAAADGQGKLDRAARDRLQELDR